MHAIHAMLSIFANTALDPCLTVPRPSLVELAKHVRRWAFPAGFDAGVD